MKRLFLCLVLFFAVLPAFCVNSITVVSPNGGENWIIGNPYAIAWTISNTTAGTVKIELYKGSAVCLVINPQIPATAGTFTWTPPATITTGSDYKVKITSLTSAAAFDFSDGFFSIGPAPVPVLTVTSPNGGENWIRGCPYAITWLTTATVGPVKIELYKGSALCLTICPQVPAGMTTYTWIPPVTVVPGNDYKVRVSSLTGTAIFDFSDGFFTISAGTITVTSPNGGETWQIGSTHLVTWTDNLCENVRIELWKGSAFHSLITPSTPSNGSFTWAIAASNTLLPGNDYRIKIMNVTNSPAATNQVFDFSDANFTIGQGNFIIVTSPNGGENWLRGTTHFITWQDNISWNVRIELWKGNVFHSLINASTPSTGSCPWAIPVTVANGNDYRVKILAVSNTSSVPLYDFSDNNFTIGGSTPAVVPFTVEKIYPNPGGSLVHIKFRGEPAGAVSIGIVDYQGNTVLNETRDAIGRDETVDIGTSTLQNGNYVVVVSQNGQIVYRDYLVINH